MRTFLILLILAGQSTRADVRDSVLKIYTVSSRPDYDNPWIMGAPSSSTGSGCVIGGGRILTNAHVVSNQTFVQVRLHGAAERLEADVLAVSHAADLALLSLRDSRALDGIEPLGLGGLPQVQDTVVVFGYPLGGDTLSATEGVVSRIEHCRYVHSGAVFLAVQLDAAVNGGNSGGPVVVDDTIVGIAMQGDTSAENIAYMVPTPVIEHFLEDLDDGRYDGIPTLGITAQKMESPALRRLHGLADRSGVLVTTVDPGTSDLRSGDVILSVDGHEVADDGTVEFRPRERTSMNYFVQRHQLGEKVELEILRAGQTQSIAVRLSSPEGTEELVPLSRYDVRPTYFVYGGLVFTRLSLDYLALWDDPPSHLAALLEKPRCVPDQEIVVLIRVLPAAVNCGYHEVADWIITEVDGRSVTNLRELVYAVEVGAGEFVTFKNTEGSTIALDRDESRRASDDILRKYRIPSDRSDDLK